MISLLFFSVDATEATSLGRYVNDAPEKLANSRPRKIFIEGHKYPSLCLYATKTIEINDEITYDYNVKGLPWRD